MVKHFLLKIYAALFIVGVFSLNGCNVDLFGLFGSADLNDRLRERGNFVFLSEEKRNISLGGEYSFIVVTDIHIEDGETHGLERLKQVIDSDDSIKFVVVTGDITQYGAAQDLQKFMDIANSLNTDLRSVPCYPVIGNHDVYFGNWPEWKRLIGSTNYRINGGGATLLIMDSANAFFGNDQLDWLERELKSASGRVFVFSHVNLFVKNPAELQQFTSTKERARVVSILRNNCDMMFMGHAHRRSINEAGNVLYVGIEAFVDTQTYCVVSVSSTGVTYRFEKL